MLGTLGGCRFAHYAKSGSRKRRIISILRQVYIRMYQSCRINPYQRAISHELRKLLVLSLVDLGLQDTESHWLFDDLVIVRYIALIDTAMEQFGRIMATANRQLLAWDNCGSHCHDGVERDKVSAAVQGQNGEKTKQHTYSSSRTS